MSDQPLETSTGRDWHVDAGDVVIDTECTTDIVLCSQRPTTHYEEPYDDRRPKATATLRAWLRPRGRA